MKHGTITCTVNPAAGREWRLAPRSLAPADPALDLLVVGGGPAGLSAAETAARRGHRVTLLERGERLGGQLLLAGRLPNRGAWLGLADDLARSVERLGVAVELGVEADAGLVAARGADRVLLAVGSRFEPGGYSHADPGRPGIPGAGAAHVLDPAQVVADPGLCGRRVVISDDVGDHLPLGLALLLAGRGHEVTVVTRMLYAGAAGMAESGDLPWLQSQMLEAGVEQRAQSRLRSIGEGAVEVSSIWAETGERLAADTVVLNTVRRGEHGLARELRDLGIEAEEIGDCLAPREVDDAIYEGADRASRL